LGNPDHEPPSSVKETLKKIVTEDKPGIHRYMNNAGYEDVRQKVADYLNRTSGLSSNVVLKTLLNPGEEVIILAPYFAEWKSGYSTTGKGQKTKAIIINSPNNPSGYIYSEETLKDFR